MIFRLITHINMCYNSRFGSISEDFTLWHWWRNELEKIKNCNNVISIFWGVGREGIAFSFRLPSSPGSPILSTNTSKDQGAWGWDYLRSSYQDCWRVVVIKARLSLLCCVEERLLHWIDELVVVQSNRCREMLQLLNHSPWKDCTIRLIPHCIYLHSTKTLWN